MQQYRAFVKDCLNLNGLPKAWYTVTSFTLSEDVLAKATSSFYVAENIENVDNGDIFVLYDPYGTRVYCGIIDGFSESQIRTSQMASFYKGLWVYRTSPSNYLEQEVASVTQMYANGETYGATETDTLMAQEKAPIKITYEVSDSHRGISLRSQDDNYTKDYEEFIYYLYNNYNMVFEFDVPETAWTIGDDDGGTVKIYTPSYTPVTVGDNAECITDMSPITEIYENNKLIIYSSEGVYRDTFYATTNGITDDPSAIGRVKNISTNIVFSDDDYNILKAQNLRNDMYNHKVTFSLNLNNNFYNWYEWKLGLPLHVWYNGHFFDTVYTGYSLTKSDNTMPVSVKITCGKVRTSLTKKLALNGVL